MMCKWNPFLNVKRYYMDKDILRGRPFIHYEVTSSIFSSEVVGAHTVAREVVSMAGCGEWLDTPHLYLINCLSSELTH